MNRVVDRRNAASPPARGAIPSLPTDGLTDSRHSVEQYFLTRGGGAEFEMEADWVRHQLGSQHGPVVVDIGCGNGALLRSIGLYNAVGMDHSAEGLVYAAKVWGGVLVCGSAEELPFASRSVGAMTSQHVIEHLTDSERACREWFRALKPGGLLLILTPNRSFCDPSVFDDATHVRIFDGDSLRQLLRDTGFEITDLRTLGMPWFRDHRALPGGWRLRRWITRHARSFSGVPFWRDSGQTLCCAARRPARQ